jgi:hypothetical protein
MQRVSKFFARTSSKPLQTPQQGTKMKIAQKTGMLVLAAVMIAGCATPEVVQTRKAGDSDLTCNQIKAEITDAQNFESKARAERGVTGKNVAAAVLFWPALLGTYSNTEDAIRAAQDRQRHLEKLAADKKCKI